MYLPPGETRSGKSRPRDSISLPKSRQGYVFYHFTRGTRPPRHPARWRAQLRLLVGRTSLAESDRRLWPTTTTMRSKITVWLCRSRQRSRIGHSVVCRAVLAERHANEAIAALLIPRCKCLDTSLIHWPDPGHRLLPGSRAWCRRRHCVGEHRHGWTTASP